VVAGLVVAFLGGAAPDAAAAACRNADVVFYSTDSTRLAQWLGPERSPCADYYISVMPVAEGNPRPLVAPAIRAVGSQFHAMAEIRLNPWGLWVAANGKTWFEAGVEVRRRMATAGYDVAQGDTWALNEVGAPSTQLLGVDVLTDTGTARDDVLEFVRGLYTGEPGMPPAPGLVFAANPTQITTDLALYKQRLRSWFRDAEFWMELSRYVRFWAQETYADARTWGVAGSTLAARTSQLTDYFAHATRLLDADPDGTAAARAFFDAAYTPVGNASYQWGPPELQPNGIGFGYTAITLPEMQAFVAAQTYALRTYFGGVGARDRFGYAFVPRVSTGAATQSAVAGRVAAAIRGSETEPSGACGPGGDWCNGEIAGAQFNPAWATFPDVTPPLIVPHVAGPLGAAGWYVGDATVSWAVSDPESPFTTSGCDPTTVDADTAGLTLTCTASSAGGSASASVTVKRDSTPPTLDTPAAIALDAVMPAGVIVIFAAAADDALDPAPTVLCTPASGTVFAIGSTTVVCSAVDEAGNTTSASFVVHVRGPDEQLARLELAVAGVGPGRSLIAKVQQVRAALTAGDADRASSLLVAFEHEVAAQSGKSIEPHVALTLVETARRLRAVLAGHLARA
jgi:hypothetical protein